MTQENLWPDDFKLPPTDDSPKRILRQQAAALSERTHAVVSGEVKTVTVGDQLEHKFYLRAQIVNYRFVLFRVLHRIEYYPVTVSWDGWPAPTTAENPDRFRTLLKEIFGSTSTRKSIGQLITISEEEGMPFILIRDDEVVAQAATLEEATRSATEIVQDDEIIDIFEDDRRVTIVRLAEDGVHVYDLNAPSHGKAKGGKRKKRPKR